MFTRPLRIIPTALLATAALLGAGAEAVSRPRELPPRWKDLSRPPTEVDVWLRRLAGRFRYEGILQRGSDGVSVKGLGDCIGVGTSPGVHCVINLEWLLPWDMRTPDPTYVANLNPAMILYGVDPNLPGMTYLQVNQRTLAEGGQGSIAGDTATFRAPCVNTGSILSARAVPQGATRPIAVAPGASSITAESGTGSTESQPGAQFGQGGAEPFMALDYSIDPSNFRGCQRVTRIDARPDARIVWVRIDIGDPVAPSYSFVLSLYRIPQTAAGEAVPSDDTPRKR